MEGFFLAEIFFFFSFRPLSFGGGARVIAHMMRVSAVFGASSRLIGMVSMARAETVSLLFGGVEDQPAFVLMSERVVVTFFRLDLNRPWLLCSGARR